MHGPVRRGSADAHAFRDTALHWGGTNHSRVNLRDMIRRILLFFSIDLISLFLFHFTPSSTYRTRLLGFVPPQLARRIIFLYFISSLFSYSTLLDFVLLGSVTTCLVIELELLDRAASFLAEEPLPLFLFSNGYELFQKGRNRKNGVIDGYY